MRKVIDLMQQKNYAKLRKICCFAPVKLVVKILKHFNVQFGGNWHFTLDSMPETKAEYSDGETLFFKETAKLVGLGLEVLTWESERGSKPCRGDGES